MTPHSDQATARGIVKPLMVKTDIPVELIVDVEHAIAQALREQRNEAFGEAIDIVMQSKDLDSVLTLLRAKAGLIKLAIRGEGQG